MISRRRCKEIARTWQTEQGVAEWNRRLESIQRHDLEMEEFARRIGQPFKIDTSHRAELARNMAEMVLTGYYDPPLPKIPGFLERLRLDDWTPPEPTAEEWPMGSHEREVSNEDD